RLQLVPQVGRLDVERLRRDGRAHRRAARGPGRLARLGFQPGRAPEAIAADPRLRPGPGGPRADAAATGRRAEYRRLVRHRAARLPTDHGRLADGADRADDGLDHGADDVVPSPQPETPVAGRRCGGDGRLHLVAVRAGQLHPEGTPGPDAGLLG